MKTISIFFTYCIIASTALAQPGTLDRTFGDTGVVISPINNGGLSSISLQNNGKIIAAGGSATGNRFGFTLSRYLSNGTLDSSFGTEGISFINNYSEIYSAIVLNDNSIIATGIDDADNNIIIAKYNENGNLDSTFGDSGQAHESFKGVDATLGAAIKVQQDGKIVIAGLADFIDADGAYEPQILTARFNADGSVDKNFAGKGYVLLKGKIANALLIQPDGKIIIGGNTGVMESFITARYLPDGSLDENYGVNGVVTTHLDHHTSYANALALQADGKIIAAGTKDDGDRNMLAVRYLTDGSVDESFGNNGFANPIFKNGSEAKSVLLQPDGKIILSGWSNNFSNFAMARLDSNGTVDSSFGENGLVVTDIGPNERSTASALQPDGKIILGGTDYTTNFTLARYNNDIQNKNPIARIKKWIEHHILHWQNIQGLNNTAYYTIESSNNATSGFKQIAGVQSSAANNIYSYILPSNPSFVQARNYYRINAINKKGAIIVSSIIEDTEAEDAAISVYPNPVKNVLHIQGLNENMKYEIRITNEKGNVFAKASANKVNSYNFNVQNLRNGIYYAAIISSSNKPLLLKFIKE